MIHIPATIGVLIEIRDERKRQVTDEGYDLAHDDRHDPGELVRAASVYTLFASLPETDRDFAKRHGPHLFGTNMVWPWDRAYFKLSDPRRDLIKAAALIVAEIERMDRAQKSSSATE